MNICSIIVYSAAKAGTHKDKGWPEWAYAVSKIGVTAMSFAQQREFDKDSREDIVLNPVSRTDKNVPIHICLYAFPQSGMDMYILTKNQL